VTAPAPPLDARLAALFARVWPALPVVAARAERLGFPWTRVSTPFVRWEGDRAIAHVGVIELSLIVGGRSRRVGSIHAVCADPDRRGGGHAASLMAEALEACRARYDTLVLTTLIPDYYTRFGFRPVPEHAFSRAWPATASGPGGRPLTEAPNDLKVLRRLLERRAPVSERLGSLADEVVFAVAVLLTWGDLSRVRYHAALDAITVHEVRDRTLLLYDVVAEAIPPLPALAAAIGADADRVLTFFAPDRLGEGFRAQPWDQAQTEALGGDWFAGLMARGPFPDEAEVMLPPLSRT
jgi:GNAT superfamily N-acetyltransferase